MTKAEQEIEQNRSLETNKNFHSVLRKIKDEFAELNKTCKAIKCFPHGFPQISLSSFHPLS